MTVPGTSAKTRTEASTPKKRAAGARALDADDALLALLIAAMAASGHVSPAELARAHNIIWSMRRFRSRSGETVGRKIDRMRTLVEHNGAALVTEAAAPAIPPRLRPAAFAVAADLVLVDGRMERAEGRYLRGLATALGLDRDTTGTILGVMRLKNSA